MNYDDIVSFIKSLKFLTEKEKYSWCHEKKDFLFGNKVIFSTISSKHFKMVKFIGIPIFRTLKKMLFVDPENLTFDPVNPIAIFDMAPYIRKFGVKVDVCRYPNLPKRKDYDIVGLSCVTGYGGSVYEQLKKLREFYPNSEIVLGGKWTHILTPEEENTVTSLGVCIEKAPAEFCYTESDEIDYENYPAWDKKDFEKLNENDFIMSARGCPFKCHFCNNTESHLSFFSAKRMAKIIKMVLEKYNTVRFMDDIFALNLKHPMAILEECKKQHIPIVGKSIFNFHIKSDLKLLTQLVEMYKPVRIEVGIESGDNRILANMNKKITVDDIREKIKTLSKYVSISGLWLIGFPGETEESLENSYQLLAELKPYMSHNYISHYIPLNHTVGYDLAKQEGGTFLTAVNSKCVSYIPPTLTEEILKKYYKKMRNLNNF